MEGTITNLIPAGDHTIYLCQVTWAHADRDGAPLLFFSRHYHQLAPLPGPGIAGPGDSAQHQQATAGSLVGVIASAAPSTRTAAAVDYTCRRARALAPGLHTDIVNLQDVPLPMCDGRELADVPSVAKIVEKISAAKSVLLATPIYRGTFTAALKNLLDWLPLESLEGKRVGLIASGATPHHYLMIDLTLRPLLAWFNAAPIPGSVYLNREDMSHEGHPCEATAARLDALAQALVAAPPVVGAVGPPALMRQLSAAMGNRIAPSACKAETTPVASRTRWLTRLTQRTVRG